jgi:IclR family pca regulon transcriptional regulator
MVDGAAGGASARAPEGMAGLVKGLAIIEAFGVARDRVTVADAARDAGISRAAARRCLLSLCEHGYLTHDGKHFRPTPRMLRLGDCYLGAAPLPQIAAPFLEQARDLLNESISVTVLENLQGMVIARAEANHIISTGARVGARMPLHCSATGRVLLTSFSEEQLDTFLNTSEFPARTPRTPTTPADIRRAVVETRRRGYATTDEELDLGMISLAVPIRERSGETAAALSVSSFTARATLEEMEHRFLPVLLDQARRIGQAM